MARHQASARPVYTLTGLVRRENGARVAGASVVVSDSGGQAGERRAWTDSAGRYVVDSLPAGAYRFRVEHPSGSTDAGALVIAGNTRRDAVLQPREETHSWMQVVLTFVCLLLYALVLIAVRWHHIARAVQSMIERQLLALQTRLQTEVGGNVPGGVLTLRKRVEEIKDEWEQEQRKRWSGFSEVVFWSRGRENAAWVVIHEIERELAAFLSPPEQVDVSLRWADSELRSINKTVAVDMADAIRDSLLVQRPTNAEERHSLEQTRKALLGRAISLIYADRDNSFSTLMEWQNKAGWLILAAVIIIGFVVLAAGHAVLFLAGAAGGYLSRLARALKREDVPLDYGASWTTLFLSPLLGAMSGWFGVALITLAADPSLNLLGSAFSLVRWDRPSAPATLAIAFALGFSERLFDAIVGAVEGHATKSEEAQRASRGAGQGPRPDAPARSNGKNGTSSTAVVSLGGVAPLVAERQRRDHGDPRDALVIKGAGFAPETKVSVNDEPHASELNSAQELLLPLDADDIGRLAMAGDFVIGITNGAGTRTLDYTDKP